MQFSVECFLEPMESFITVLRKSCGSISMCTVEVCSSSEFGLWLYVKFFSCSKWQISSWRRWKGKNCCFFLVCALGSWLAAAF